MTYLKTKYIVIGLDNLIFLGASNTSKDLDKLKRVEECCVAVGEVGNTPLTQLVLYHRANCNNTALRGGYNDVMERT
jgi:hypothetical protein